KRVLVYCSLSDFDNSSFVNVMNYGNLSLILFSFALYSHSFLLLLRQINETIILINAWQM
ncbi:hypothetical protein, partial [Bacteroides heparinolyticus]|uniref:hypothetical protein n=1 Tax=Prevotella heparinolytica TaxID=28113 RepID=UPI00359FF24F